MKEMMQRDFAFPSFPVIYQYKHSTNPTFSRHNKSSNLYHLSSRTHEQPLALFDRSRHDYLHSQYGDTPVVLSSSNTYSHGRIESTLREYLENILSKLASPSERSAGSGRLLANESYYLFGNNYQGIWKELSDLYLSPPCHLCDKAGAKTIGIGGKNSGVSFHFHGSGFSEVIHGSKSWFLFPPRFNSLVSQLFDANMTVLQWYQQIYPLFINLSDEASTALLDFQGGASLPSNVHSAISELLPHFLECTITTGEMLYFPPFWMHATLNRDEYNVFFSHFLDLQLMKE